MNPFISPRERAPQFLLPPLGGEAGEGGVVLAKHPSSNFAAAFSCVPLALPVRIVG